MDVKSFSSITLFFLSLSLFRDEPLRLSVKTPFLLVYPLRRSQVGDKIVALPVRRSLFRPNTRSTTVDRKSWRSVSYCYIDSTGTPASSSSSLHSLRSHQLFIVFEYPVLPGTVYKKRMCGNLIQKNGKTTTNKFNDTSTINNVFRVNVLLVFHYY